MGGLIPQHRGSAKVFGRFARTNEVLVLSKLFDPWSLAHSCCGMLFAKAQAMGEVAKAPLSCVVQVRKIFEQMRMSSERALL